jgi:glycosyltransferase involved in cell wall biosynthesis
VRFAVLTSTPLNRTEGSGTFVALDTLAAGLARAGHTVGIRPVRVRTRFHTLDRYLYNVGVALRPPVADVVVGVDLDGFLWARRRAGRYVVSLKGIIADELRHERGLTRALLGHQARWERLNAVRADRVLVPSEYSAGVAEREYGVPRDRVAVVPEPIDIDGWQRRLAAAARRPSERPVVLSVGRMYPRKHFQDLLLAARLLRDRLPGVEVRIVGNGPEWARLQALREEGGLADTVALLGEMAPDRLAAEYASADCFCLPTVQEGFGIVFAEAMVAGLAVVACRAAAVPEVVADRRTGLLVNPESPEELAMALETLLTNHGLRKDLGNAGRARVEQFAQDRVVARFVEAAAG